jgi:ActR/RegA family two-component response regulator
MDRVLRVLIVEDDEELAGTLRKVLSRAGYSATMANTAREGWETLQHGRFDAVVLDMKTGDIGLGERYAEYPGLYVLDNAAQLEQPPKVVVLTGYPALDTAVDALAGGRTGEGTRLHDQGRHHA